MRLRWAVLAAVGLAVSGCARVAAPFSSFSSPQPPPPPPPPSAAVNAKPAPIHPLYRCPPNTPCAPKEKSVHRQYYDTHHRRYYYFDPATRRYYWEDGQPKT
jgi:hypothetical protein